jgi:hypothetical protein
MEANKQIIISEYDQQALDFLSLTGATITKTFFAFDRHLPGDKDKRIIWNITIERTGRSFSFKFGDSLHATQEALRKAGFGLMNDWHKHFSYPAKKLADNDFIKLIPQSRIAKYAKAPSDYDILACLTKHDPESFSDFCSNFGYDEDSRSAEKTYNAVANDWKNLQILFTDSEIEKLQEIN